MVTNPTPAPKTIWQQVKDFLWNHRAKATIVGMIVFSTFVHSLPAMIHSSHGFVVWFYSYFYDLMHALAGGLGHPVGSTNTF